MSLPDGQRKFPDLTFLERQELIRATMAADDLHLSQADNEVLEQRVADFEANPGNEVRLEEMQAIVLGRMGAARSGREGRDGETDQAPA